MSAGLKTITRIRTFGDSLTDCGKMNQSFFMRLLSGLMGKSSSGRFTNGYTWLDHFFAMLANQFLIDRSKKKKSYQVADLADQVINQDPKISAEVKLNYHLAEAEFFKYKGHDFVHNYSIGGLTASDYSHKFSWNPARFFSRKILNTLNDKVNESLAYDEDFKTPQSLKAQTLTIGWTGANDILTVNTKPNKKAVDRAIKAQMDNMTILYKHGYRDFILFNMPDLSLLPRMQKLSIPEQKNATRCSLHFNSQLQIATREFKANFVGSSMEVFDVASYVDDMYYHPQKYQFAESKLKQTLTESKNFKKGLPDPTQREYLWWDEVHPTAPAHVYIANAFHERCKKSFHFEAPKMLSVPELVTIFCRLYDKKRNQDRHSFFGQFTCSQLKIDRKNSNHALYQILNHGLNEKGERTREILLKLGWINKKNKINVQLPALRSVCRKIAEEKQKRNRSCGLR